MAKGKDLGLKWMAYYYSTSKNEVVPINIFQHSRFNDDVTADVLNKKLTDKDEFAKKLRSNLMYYFWSKCEYEIVLSPWCGVSTEDKDIKIDIYDQVFLNWDIFLNYVWSFKKL